MLPLDLAPSSSGWVIVSILLNLQVQRLGSRWPEMAGGTPNYAARLLKTFLFWVAGARVLRWMGNGSSCAIILTDLIKTNLEPLGIACPETILKIGFIASLLLWGLAYPRLGNLALIFVIPAITFLLAFCLSRPRVVSLLDH